MLIWMLALCSQGCSYKGSADYQNEFLYNSGFLRIPEYEVQKFSSEVFDISQELGISPSWLMVVFTEYSEGFRLPLLMDIDQDYLISNHGITHENLKELSYLQQLKYVYAYFDLVIIETSPFVSVSDLLISSINPEFRGQEFDFVINYKPSWEFETFQYWDTDRDGFLTPQDIENYIYFQYRSVYTEPIPKP